MSEKFVKRDYLLEQFEGYDRSIASQKYATIATVDNKVDKVSGKGLSTNDYDNTAKDIVDNVTTNLASKVDNSTLGSYYTKTEVDTLISGIDLSGYVQKSQTGGLLKNDGTVDTNTYLTQHQDISSKQNVSLSTPLVINEITCNTIEEALSAIADYINSYSV